MGALAVWSKHAFSVSSLLGPWLDVVSPHIADSHLAIILAAALLPACSALCQLVPPKNGVPQGSTLLWGSVPFFKLWLLEPMFPVLSAQPGESFWSLDCGLCCLVLLTECPGLCPVPEYLPCSLELFAHVLPG